MQNLKLIPILFLISSSTYSNDEQNFLERIGTRIGNFTYSLLNKEVDLEPRSRNEVLNLGCDEKNQVVKDVEVIIEKVTDRFLFEPGEKFSEYRDRNNQLLIAQDQDSHIKLKYIYCLDIAENPVSDISLSRIFTKEMEEHQVESVRLIRADGNSDLNLFQKKDYRDSANAPSE